MMRGVWVRHLYSEVTMPHPNTPSTQTVTLTIKVQVKVDAAASIESFVGDMDYSIISNTAGVTVVDTEVTDASCGS